MKITWRYAVASVFAVGLAGCGIALFLIEKSVSWIHWRLIACADWVEDFSKR